MEVFEKKRSCPEFMYSSMIFKEELRNIKQNLKMCKQCTAGDSKLSATEYKTNLIHRAYFFGTLLWCTRLTLLEARVSNSVRLI